MLYYGCLYEKRLRVYHNRTGIIIPAGTDYQSTKRERMMKNYLKKTGMKRIWMTIIGNIFIGLGIAVFRYAALGNDPFTAMNLSLSERVGMSYPTFQVIFNLCVFVIQLIWGRELIGIGTIVNACFLGYIVDFFYKLLLLLPVSAEALWLRVFIVLVGVIIISFGLSLYQTSDVGVAPYDALSLITGKKLPRIPYFWHRMFDDALAAVASIMATGFTNIGLGSVVSAFGLGPFIHFFNKHFSEKLLRDRE